MKRNIILTIIVVAALGISALGSTLAGFSDTETSANNFFEVGNLDLKVADSIAHQGGVEFDDDAATGTLPFTLAQATMTWPGNSQDYSFWMHNKSEPDGKQAWAYLRFKDIANSEFFTAKFPSPNGPEPKDVAEDGGWLAGTNIPGVDDLDLSDYLEIVLWFDTNGDGTLERVIPLTGVIHLSDLNEADGKYVKLCQIPACNTREGKIELRMLDIPEGNFQLNYFANDLPFDHWPTNALMNNKSTFSVEFALTQEPIPVTYLINP